MSEIRDGKGRVIGVESDSGDMIAQALLDGEDGLDTLAGQLLVPCPFVITCNDGGMACGEGVESRARAVAEGWRWIEFVPDALGESYWGVCGECWNRLHWPRCRGRGCFGCRP